VNAASEQTPDELRARELIERWEREHLQPRVLEREYPHPNSSLLLTVVGLFGTVLAMAVTASIWIGHLQAEVNSDSAWIAARDRLNIDSRMATVETRQQDVRAKLEQIEQAFHRHELEDNKMFQQIYEVQQDVHRLERMLEPVPRLKGNPNLQ
jgi:uncharacterized protein HemX